MDNTELTRNINIRVSEEQFNKLKKHCNESYMSWSSYIRLLLDLGYGKLKMTQKESCNECNM